MRRHADGVVVRRREVGHQVPRHRLDVILVDPFHVIPHTASLSGAKALDFHGRCTTMLCTMSNLTVRIPKALRKELEALSRQEQRPASDVVRESLRRYIAAQKFRRLRRRTLPFAEAQGFLTDEDVFEAIS
jgi:predicted transcriptional regulator